MTIGSRHGVGIRIINRYIATDLDEKISWRCNACKTHISSIAKRLLPYIDFATLSIGGILKTWDTLECNACNAFDCLLARVVALYCVKVAGWARGRRECTRRAQIGAADDD